MGTCKECNKRHPDFYCPVNDEFEKSYKYFFDYFLGTHAIGCTKQDCVCRASTFMDLICEPVLRKSKKYGRDIEEVLDRDKEKNINPIKKHKASTIGMSTKKK